MRLTLLLFVCLIGAFAQQPSNPWTYGSDGTVRTKGTRNVGAGTECPGGAPAGSVCANGNVYAGGVQVTGGGGGTPGGANTQVQYNGSGAFSGDSSFTFNSTTKDLTVTSINGKKIPISPTIINALDYGAVGDDGVTDNYTPLTNAITAACAAASTSEVGKGVVLYIPGASGSYKYSKVPHVNCSNVTVVGDGSKTELAPSYDGGMAFLIGPSSASGTTMAVPTTTALATGTGSAMTIDTNANRYLSLSDTTSSRINGLSAITVELYVKVSSIANGPMFISSAGNGVNNGSLNLYVASDGTPTCRLNVANTDRALSGAAGTFLVNTLYHFAVSYDGATMNCYLNGTRFATASFTGNITQKDNEQMVVPGRVQRWPDGGNDFAGAAGSVDSIRISNTARYTGASFTAPTAKFTADANTLLVVNFDSQYDVFTEAQDTNGAHRIPLMYRSEWTGGGIVRSALRNIAFHGAAHGFGPMIYKDPRSIHSNVIVAGGQGGMLFSNNCFESSLDSYQGEAGFSGYSQFQLATSNQVGVMRLSNLYLYSGAYMLVQSGGSIDFTRGWFQMESDTLEAIRLIGDGETFFNGRGLIVNSESGAPALTYGVHAISMWQVALYDSDLEMTSGVTAFYTESPTRTMLTNIRFAGGQTATSGLIKVTGGTNAILVVNPQNDNGAAFSDTLSRIQIYDTNYETINGFRNSVVGSALASGSTITPTSSIHHVTGTSAIATITVPNSMSSSVGGCIRLIADAAWTTTTAGNIKAAMTAAANTLYNACYDGSKWFIK